MKKSNSTIDIHQRASLDCSGAFKVSHLKLAWSVMKMFKEGKEVK